MSTQGAQITGAHVYSCTRCSHSRVLIRSPPPKFSARTRLEDAALHNLAALRHACIEANIAVSVRPLYALSPLVPVIPMHTPRPISAPVTADAKHHPHAAGTNIAVIPSLSSNQSTATTAPAPPPAPPPPPPPPDPAAQQQRWRQLADAQLRHNTILRRIDAALERWRPTIRAGGLTGPCIRPASPPAASASAEPAFVPDAYQRCAIAAAEAGESFFLTGSAGTGKSYVLKHIIRALRARGREVAVTASTGCAAVAINGNTVHSATGVGLGLESMEEFRRRARTSRRMRELLTTIDVLVIDEVSMIDSYLFDKIELVTTTARAVQRLDKQSSRWSRKKRRLMKAQADKPFGGVQVIVCGDFFQLPPVAASDWALQHSKEKYFAFEAAAWKNTIKRTIVLRVVHRQSDVNFVGLLNEARYGVVSQSSQHVLEACLINPYADHLEITPSGDPLVFTKLFSYRKQVDKENYSRLHKITGYPGVKYVARDRIDDDQLGNLTRGAVQALLNNVQGLHITELKERSRVLCVKNIDKDNGIVNGSAGYVVGFQLPIEANQISFDAWEKMSPKQKQDAYETLAKKQGMTKQSLRDKDMQEKLKRTPRDTENGFFRMDGEHPDVIPVVRFDNGTEMAMLPQRWDVYNVKGDIMAWRSQIPLTLGWALSIHKSQGMSLPMVQTDLSRAFDFGQVYVAISRATSVQGLRLTSFDRNRVMAHEKVLKFYAKAEEEEARVVKQEEEGDSQVDVDVEAFKSGRQRQRGGGAG